MPNKAGIWCGTIGTKIRKRITTIGIENMPGTSHSSNYHRVLVICWLPAEKAATLISDPPTFCVSYEG